MTQPIEFPEHRCLYARLYVHKPSGALMVSCQICYTSLACSSKNDRSWGGSALEARIAKDQNEWYTRKDANARVHPS